MKFFVTRPCQKFAAVVWQRVCVVDLSYRLSKSEATVQDATMLAFSRT